ncbi:transposase [Streptomyces sp. NPDC056431]|uniref:transposase n=1 Tax=Streptomyces sp. NPDC056431 TaxID=3345814 RepID=UPI0036BDF5FC
MFKFRTGLPWRDLPERFDPWQTVHGRFAHWAADGTFDRLLAAAGSGKAQDPARSRGRGQGLLGPRLPRLPPPARDQGHDPRTRRPARGTQAAS